MQLHEITCDFQDGSRCLWQITPQELPSDLRPMALELWQTPAGLVLLQLFVDGPRRGDWYRRIAAVTRFEVAQRSEAPPSVDPMLTPMDPAIRERIRESDAKGSFYAYEVADGFAVASFATREGAQEWVSLQACPERFGVRAAREGSL